jgi:thiol:disulfide interchange protein
MPPAEGGAPPVAPAPPTRRSGSSRAAPVALLALAGVLLVARVATGIYDHLHPPTRPDLVEWRDPETGQAEARATGKPILYDFTADWCGPCRQMQREVFAKPASAERINAGLVPIRVLDRAREEGRNPPGVEALQKRFGVTAFPTLVVASPDGGRFESKSGYRGAFMTTQFITNAAMLVTNPFLGRRGAPWGTRDSTRADSASAWGPWRTGPAPSAGDSAGPASRATFAPR